MSATIDGVAGAAGLPPPLLLSTPDATQLAFTLKGDRVGTAVVQLISSRNGEGGSTLVRDICLVSAAGGARTLLFAAETPGLEDGLAAQHLRHANRVAGACRAVRLALEMLRVGDTQLVLGRADGGHGRDARFRLGSRRSPGCGRSFDLIVIDAPALERSFIGIMLAPHSGCVLPSWWRPKARGPARHGRLRDRLAEVGGATVGRDPE